MRTAAGRSASEGAYAILRPYLRGRGRGRVRVRGRGRVGAGLGLG